MTTGAREKAIIVGVASRAVPRAVIEEQLDELERLVDTAGADVVARFVKERPAPDPATYVGKGSVEEIGGAARSKGASLVVFDDELTPGQARNLEERWGEGIRALDRPGVILDVFASHARTREARTQVELAQLQYLLPRLTGRYGHLSRLGCGIGGRGPGEQKLEVDRRKIRKRIARLREDLSRIEKSRAVRRRGRRGLLQVAIAGYTNAGKTTLFNRLTRESAYTADRLFATLDARVARAASRRLPHVVFIDTVGFVRKLPTTLVASFRSTLAEIREADLVLHAVDASSARAEEERRIALEVLEELGVGEERILTVWTKRDALAGGGAAPFVARGKADGLFVSALTGEGIERLEEEVCRRARPQGEEFLVRIPYGDGRSIAAARAAFRVVEEKDSGDALLLRLEGERRAVPALLPYVKEESRPVRALRRRGLRR
ncbi:MAG TPA: GTPase HflX [Thermoanaerobaculia bacterium]|nr:GTPase HflX [Thermoanaerobaculia bacterium]